MQVNIWRKGFLECMEKTNADKEICDYELQEFETWRTMLNLNQVAKETAKVQLAAYEKCATPLKAENARLIEEENRNYFEEQDQIRLQRELANAEVDQAREANAIECIQRFASAPDSEWKNTKKQNSGTVQTVIERQCRREPDNGSRKKCEIEAYWRQVAPNSAP